MPIEPRAPREHELSLIVSTLTKNLRPNHGWSLDLEYPTILSTENILKNSLCIFDEHRLVSFAAYYPFQINTMIGIFPVAGVGQVWTDPDYRGQGLALTVLKRLHQKMSEENFAFSILWTGDPRLYGKLNYVPAGRELDWMLDGNSLPEMSPKMQCLELGPLTEHERVNVLPQIASMHSTHRFRVHRGESEWESYAHVPKSQWWITHECSAYVVVGKGADLTSMVHEWGGDVQGIWFLLGHIARASGHGLTLMTPDDESEPLLKFLSSTRIERHIGIVGYACPLKVESRVFSSLMSRETTRFYCWGFDSV